MWGFVRVAHVCQLFERSGNLGNTYFSRGITTTYGNGDNSNRGDSRRSTAVFSPPVAVRSAIRASSRRGRSRVAGGVKGRFRGLRLVGRHRASLPFDNSDKPVPPCRAATVVLSHGSLPPATRRSWSGAAWAATTALDGSKPPAAAPAPAAHGPPPGADSQCPEKEEESRSRHGRATDASRAATIEEVA